MTEKLASLAIPLVIVSVSVFMIFGKKEYFESFIRGAREGLKSSISLLPTLVALMVAISMLRASGASELISRAISPVTDRIGVPHEILGLLVVRPFSGSASNAAYASLLKELGADSFPSLCASVIMGSSDTLVYVISVYFSSVGIKKSRYAFPVAIAVMLFCVFFSCLLCRSWFKGAV